MLDILPGKWSEYSRWLMIFARVFIILFGSAHLNYVGELFPTEVRGNALSLRALCGSIATIITPAVLASQYWVI